MWFSSKSSLAEPARFKSCLNSQTSAYGVKWHYSKPDSPQGFYCTESNNGYPLLTGQKQAPHGLAAIRNLLVAAEIPFATGKDPETITINLSAASAYKKNCAKSTAASQSDSHFQISTAPNDAEELNWPSTRPILLDTELKIMLDHLNMFAEPFDNRWNYNSTAGGFFIGGAASTIATLSENLSSKIIPHTHHSDTAPPTIGVDANMVTLDALLRAIPNTTILAPARARAEFIAPAPTRAESRINPPPAHNPQFQK